MNIINFFVRIAFGQPLVDPMCPHTSPLPLDVKCFIFQNMKTELPTLALVCKNWKIIVDDKAFRETIRPTKTFGSSEWKEYIGVDAGLEHPLPRRAYGDMEKGNYFLTFIPEKVKKTPVNGKVDDTCMDVELLKEIPLDSLEVIYNLVSNAINGNKVGHAKEIPPTARQEKRTLEKPHWVMIGKELSGRNLYYQDQRWLVKEENKNMPRASISGLMDTAICVYMEYVRSGERNFLWDPSKRVCKVVRVNEQTQALRLGLSFAASEDICILGVGDGLSREVGFVPAWKSFEHLNT